MKQHKLYLKDYGFTIMWDDIKSNDNLVSCDYFSNHPIYGKGSKTTNAYYQLIDDTKTISERKEIYDFFIKHDFLNDDFVDDYGTSRQMIDIIKPYILTDNEEMAFYLKLKYGSNNEKI